MKTNSFALFAVLATSAIGSAALASQQSLTSSGANSLDSPETAGTHLLIGKSEGTGISVTQSDRESGQYTISGLSEVDSERLELGINFTYLRAKSAALSGDGRPSTAQSPFVGFAVDNIDPLFDILTNPFEEPAHFESVLLQFAHVREHLPAKMALARN